MEFNKFPKMPRVENLKCCITEKIDGTNAQIVITDDGGIFTGSRTQWITSENDNYGFAAWVETYKAFLQTLPPGRYYGEWWGAGIHRHYGMKERYFSPFNPRFCELLASIPEVKPIPLLYEGVFTCDLVDHYLLALKDGGSIAAPGWTRPEGIVVYFPDFNTCMKATFDGPKWKQGK